MKKLSDANVHNRRVANYAITLQRLTQKPKYTLMEQADDLDRLVQGMKTGTVSFIFIGQDGQIHHVKGTLRNYRKVFKRHYFHKTGNMFIPFFNPDINAWRTFQLTGIAHVEDNE